MGKIRFLFGLSLLSLFSLSQAAEMCPEVVYASYGQFTAPSGWHITTNSINISDPEIARDPHFEMTFSIADYNRYLLGKAVNLMDGDDKKISCWYFNHNKTPSSFVVITTDRGGIKNPVSSGTKWKAVTDDSAVCGIGPGEKKVTDCPWNY